MQNNWHFLVMGKSHKLVGDVNVLYCYVLVMLINRVFLVMLTNKVNDNW
jgi:hypothetical protein